MHLFYICFIVLYTCRQLYVNLFVCRWFTKSSYYFIIPYEVMIATSCLHSHVFNFPSLVFLFG